MKPCLAFHSEVPFSKVLGSGSRAPWPGRIVAACIALCGGASLAAAQHTWVPIHSPVQRVIVVDNSQVEKAWWSLPAAPHKAGYNGIAHLSHGNLERSLLVPWRAGLNFEHIFSGDEASYAWPRFAPRLYPMTLTTHGLNSQVELLQTSAGNWPLTTIITIERRNAETIDFQITCIPWEDVWKKHGYIGLFFATYIRKPADPSIHFIGRSRPGLGSQEPRWIKHLPPSYGVEMSHRPAGSNWDPPYDPGFHIGPVTGFSSFEYLYPFYYGVSNGKAVIFMFEPSQTGELRFAHVPNGGGLGSPAWDFSFMQRSYDIGTPFSFRGALVVKDYINHEDVIHTYESWSGETVLRP